MRFSRASIIVLVLSLALSILGPVSANGSVSPEAVLGETAAHSAAASGLVAGEILVKFKPGTSGQAIASAHQQNGGQVKEVIPGIDVHVVGVPAGQESAHVATYARNPNVEFAEVNGFYTAIAAPNDPQVSQQWQYSNTGQTGGKNDADIDAFEAWSVTSGSSSVAIAILDTGIDQSHEDLKSKLVQNVNFSNSATVDDTFGHGTHVASSAAAATNNGVGVAGTCPACALYNVKVIGDNGGGAWSWIARGITWAADNNAKVINMSFGDYTNAKTVDSAVNYAWSKGVVLTAAAGNDGVTTQLYPAAYPSVIAVAATDADDSKASFSNYGPWVDVAAPGDSILSTAPDHPNTIWGAGVKYGTISGTSMASPHVAGVAGLAWSAGLCGTDNACARSLVENRADPITGTGTYWARGRINAYNSVLRAWPLTPTAAATVAVGQVPSNALTSTITPSPPIATSHPGLRTINTPMRDLTPQPGHEP